MGRHIVKYTQNNGVLPAGYEQLEYIKATGQQYISTSLTPFSSLNYEIKMTGKMTILYNYQGLLNTSTHSTAYESWVYDAGGATYRYTGNRTPDIVIVDNTVYDFVWTGDGIDKHSLTIYYNSELVDSKYVTSTTTISDTLELYKCSATGFIGYIYGTTIKRDGVLLEQLIPALHTTDGIVGMYGITTNTFYPSASTSNFIAGPSVSKVNRGLVLTREGEIPVVPPGYTQLKYIRTTGTQYINTGLPAKDTTGFKLDISTNEAGYEKGIIATSNGSTHFVLQNHITGAAFYFTATTGTIAHLTSFYSDFGTRHLIKYNDDGLKKCYRDELYLTTNTYTLKDQIDNPLFLFSRNGYNTPSETCGKYTFYEGWIYDAGVEIMHLVPAKDSTGVVGLYDTISDSFLTNQGTGVFEEGKSSIKIVPHAIKTAEVNN